MMKIIDMNKVFLGLIGLFLTVSVSSDAVYTYPLGIPDPLTSWVPDDYSGDVIHPIWGDAPASWSIAKESGVAAYYIDNTHDSSTDSNNEFGSPDKPRNSIPEITYATGSYVEIHGGPYTGGGQLILTANGTVDKPVWIRGASADEMPEITGTTILKGEYIFLENLKYTQQSKTMQLRAHKSSTLHHVVIRNCIFTGAGTASGNGSAIAIYGESSSNRFYDIIVFNNQISYMGNSYSEVDSSLGEAPENDFHGILVRSNADRVWVLNNTIHHMGGDSIQVGVASTNDVNRTSHTYIGGNDFYSNLENGVDVKEADYTVISSNTINDWITHKNNSSTGTAVVVHNGATNTWIINNSISNAGRGVSVTGASLDTWIVGNIIEDIKHATWDNDWNATSVYSSGAAIHFRGGSSGGAINNTIVGIDKGIEMTTGTYTIVNNIISERNEKATYDIQIESTGTANIISNNLIYHPSFSLNLKNVICNNCLYIDPSFINDSYEINDDMAGIAAGFSFSFLQDKFKDVFDGALDFDIALNARVSGGIDIGAYENINSTESTSLVSVPIAPVIDQVVIE